MSEILESLKAFNINGISYLYYTFSQNWSIIIILIAAVLTSVLYVKEEIVLTTREKQNIL